MMDKYDIPGSFRSRLKVYFSLSAKTHMRSKLGKDSGMTFIYRYNIAISTLIFYM